MPIKYAPRFQFFTRDEIVTDTVSDEEGFEVTREFAVWHIYAEDSLGRRWTHKRSFSSANMGRAAELAAESVSAACLAAARNGKLTTLPEAIWTPAAPCYGSEAYAASWRAHAAADDLCDGSHDGTHSRRFDELRWAA